MVRRAWLVAFSVGCLVACREERAPPPTTATSHASAPAPSGAVLGVEGGSAEAAGSPACAALECRGFASVEEAFEAAVSGAPRVVAVGEAHAQKGSEAVPSSARRFSEAIVPRLKGRASDLLVELMMPPRGCAAKTEEVKGRQKVVTEKQAEGDQGEYVAMGNAARKVGVVPDLLRPTCADMDAVAKAGDGAPLVMLETIRRLTIAQTERLLARQADAGESMIVTYGGALHNDRVPSAERAGWSFGPDLERATGGRYVEIDLFVREHLSDDASWRKFEWFDRFDRAKDTERAILITVRPRSFVIVTPRWVAP